MEKLFVIPQYFADTFEPSVQVLDLDRPGEKVASEAWEYIKDVKPEKGKRFILVIAMGAGEYYSSNKNGDFFTEKDLLLGYKNFETGFDSDGKINSGALIYKHHKNKLHKGHPWFGIVKKSFYNHKMHRVELLLELHADKAQDLVDRVDNGDILSVSMGVRIPADKCSICGNWAKKHEEYCTHLRFHMNQILPDGRKVYAINGDFDYTKHKKPLNFFDISVVFRPADYQGYMLKKVAEEEDGPVISSCELFEKEAFLKEKIAYVRKLATIDKVIKGLPIAEKDDSSEVKAIKASPEMVKGIISQMDPLSHDHINSLSRFPMNKILATLSANNIILTTPEFLSLLVRKVTGKHIPLNILKGICMTQAKIFEEIADNPEVIEEVSDYDMFKDVDPDPEIEKVISDIKDKRDLSEKGISKKASTDLYRSILSLDDRQYPWGKGKGMLHAETVTDHKTGKQYVVNMDAVEDAKWWTDMTASLKSLRNLLLLGGAAAALSASKNQTAKALSGLAGIAAVGLGLYGLKDAFLKDSDKAYVSTDQGTRIPRKTIMMEKQSALNDTVQRFIRKGRLPLGVAAPIAAVPIMSKYYKDRLEKGVAGVPQEGSGKALEQVGQSSYVHPVLTGALGVAGANLGFNGLEGLRKVVFKR